MDNKNRYELVLIVNQSKTQDELITLVEKIKEPILKNKGTIVKEENWGLKDFAYEIKKQRKGHYFLLQFDLNSEKISEVEWVYRFQREILRFLLINLTSEKTYFKQQELNVQRAREEKKRARERELQKATSLGNSLVEVSGENLNDFTSSKPTSESENSIVEEKLENVNETVVEATKEDVPETMTESKTDEKPSEEIQEKQTLEVNERNSQKEGEKAETIETSEEKKEEN